MATPFLYHLPADRQVWRKLRNLDCQISDVFNVKFSQLLSFAQRMHAKFGVDQMLEYFMKCFEYSTTTSWCGRNIFQASTLAKGRIPSSPRHVLNILLNVLQSSTFLTYNAFGFVVSLCGLRYHCAIANSSWLRKIIIAFAVASSGSSTSIPSAFCRA